MNGVQLRMARAALGLTVREAAERCLVSHDTIVRIEKGETVKQTTLATIRGALEDAGVEFIPENGGGAGVRLRRIP
ncbi:helix-turn-helix domain-containing protein [Acuticoccus sp. M5D2P5]|uniref:helix-turn-helix domain-containing protein n=1 Tax=Acuticoccus kalidii TaxID=2910977 RepID=UPI001F2369E2|nr:helix-turn-helix transcriptional regulator [Acuticoccus kalidii]MCF3932969.1 helix-turn-helix domain-containing protein [Acuticoccus kalidii]